MTANLSIIAASFGRCSVIWMPSTLVLIGWRVHLEVEGVLVRGTAGEVEHDDRFVPAFARGVRIVRQHVGERQASEGQASYLQELPPGKSIAKPAPLTQDLQHLSLLRLTARTQAAPASLGPP
jgi:hypothetical protein